MKLKVKAEIRHAVMNLKMRALGKCSPKFLKADIQSMINASKNPPRINLKTAQLTRVQTSKVKQILKTISSSNRKSTSTNRWRHPNPIKIKDAN